METNALSLGSSLLVPCVQELAKLSLESIPPRYVRQDQDQPINVQNQNVEVPVIDMERLLSQESMHSELAKLHCACRDWGFFQLVNHQVSASLLEKMKIEVQEFFNLPMEKKKKLWQYPGEVEGFGQPLLETLDTYSWEVKNLAKIILAQMAKTLEMEAKEMTEIFEDGHQSIRINYYPPCPQPEKVIGLTPHSDATGLTILLQLNEVEGLQINKNGKWVTVKPIPNAFIINIGDILEIISNGRYRSIEHRATVNSEKERLSIATFYAPKVEAEIGPAPSLITQQTPALFKRIGVEEYFRSLFARELHSKSHLHTLRI
ncbi:Naringenin,2-oxoglutarate 3-dioxygenase, putative [Ricinus communis]|uniref:Naringenin,2-oxoglutarate 3-dioxygenase, putative n=1 Tax=Ricinus communis TaxID=3988 RepID=B9SR52_RICCO|nr:Naringenin,2-oxoglutarate 3-dioxygenase, putative [Ricinus communis]